MGIALYNHEKGKSQTALFWSVFFVIQHFLIRINVPDFILQRAAYYSSNSITAKIAR